MGFVGSCSHVVPRSPLPLAIAGQICRAKASLWFVKGRAQSLCPRVAPMTEISAFVADSSILGCLARAKTS